MKQRPQERLARLFQGLDNTPVMGAEILLFPLQRRVLLDVAGLEMLHEQTQTSGGLQVQPWKAENKSMPLVISRRRRWLVFSFADSCLNKCLFKKETYL